MNKSLLTGVSLLFTAGVSLAAGTLRPAATPLVSCDPYFSVWSNSNELNGGPTRHWTGKPQRFTSLVRIDGQTFRVMGDAPSDVPAAKQTGLTVLPTRTIYEFEQSGVHLSLTFLTPLVPDDLSVCSRPITYLTWTARSTSNDAHDVSVYIDASAELAVNKPDQTVTTQAGNVGDLKTLRVGTVEQPVLETRGDDQRIDWGYFYLAADTKSASIVPADEARAGFGKSDELPKAKVAEESSAADAPVLAMAFPLGKVSSDAKSTRVMLAYDDLHSIRYFNTDLKAYWTKDGVTFDKLLQTAHKEYDSLNKRAEAFDKELVADLQKIGGDSYEQIGVLAWRQSLAAQKICVDANGQPLMFSKENFSNGCIGTVDVLYPAAPLMMAFSPSMLKASVRPIMDYSASDRWKHNNAPHDLGQYPHATGQVYGGGDSNGGMPVEETGNMLVMLAVIAELDGNGKFSEPYWNVITKWYDYLKDKGLDPENQLTTDDFAGHIARNTNLSAKAIMGIASYGLIAEKLGKKSEAAEAMKVAKDYAKKWEEMAADGDHYALVFGDKGKNTWSQKYNIVWDKLLGFNVFSPDVIKKEIAYYKTKFNKYGLPLDSRRGYTKLDWELWTATMADDKEFFRMIVDAAAKFINETTDRVPMSDWYETENTKKSGFQARSVVGGVFIPFLAEKDLWKKYASRDKLNPTGWASVDFSAPQVKFLVPAADKEAATWKYTFDKPGDNWMKPEFDAGEWKSGKGGFGTRGTPGTKIGTEWSSSDIYIRREFTLPPGEHKDLKLWLHHDEEAEVYINGVLAARPRGFKAEYVPVNIMRPAIRALKPGKNTIAIHCHQETGGQYIDAGFVEMVWGKKR